MRIAHFEQTWPRYDADRDPVVRSARTRGSGGCRQAAFHLQQAAERLIKAVLAAQGTAILRTHQLGALASLLPEDHPCRPDLMALDRLTGHAMALRYPTAAGGLPAAPCARDITSDLADLTTLVDTIET